MSACFCTGRCLAGGTCAAFPHGRSGYHGSVEVGRTGSRPLTEDDVRRIIREELKRSKAKS
jgi:hypothetical protein